MTARHDRRRARRAVAFASVAGAVTAAGGTTGACLLFDPSDYVTVVTDAGGEASVEAGGDAAQIAEGGDGGAARFCDSKNGAGGVVFCDDFDDANRTGMSGWAPSISYPLPTLETAVFFSPPRSARCVYGNPDSGVDGRSAMVKNFTLASSAKTAIVHARVRSEIPSSGAVLGFGFGGTFIVLAADNGVAVYHDNGYQAGPGVHAIALGTWLDVTLSVTRGTTEVHIEASVDDDHATADVAVPNPDLGTSGQVTVGNSAGDHVGIFFYDDVWLETR